jgi:hypothetical protein
MDRKSVQSGIWLIGIGVLLLTGYWWPGILILIGLSMLANAMMPEDTPARVEMPAPTVAVDESGASMTPEGGIPPALGEGYSPEPAAHSTAVLPGSCPMCGGPVLAMENELEWIGYQSARCPWCAVELPLPEPTA